MAPLFIRALKDGMPRTIGKTAHTAKGINAMTDYNSSKQERSRLKQEIQTRVSRLEQEMLVTLQLHNGLQTQYMAEMAKLSRVDSAPMPPAGCTECFINTGHIVALKPIPSKSRIDRFRCQTCGREATLDPKI